MNVTTTIMAPCPSCGKSSQLSAAGGDCMKCVLEKGYATIVNDSTVDPFAEVVKPEAMRFNTGKPQLSYLLDLPHALEALVRVYEQGAYKYARGNWKLGGKPDEEYLDSALRHLMDHKKKGTYDDDIGTMHVANAVWNLLALIELNMKDLPVMDPDFDHEAFKAKYAK